MRISLFYGEDAGHGVSARELREQLTRQGHEIVHVVEKSEADPVIDGSIELAVAAGGDGTVATAAAAVAGRNTPLAILPLGTANNVARSLGIEGRVPDIIESWGDAAPRPVDVGLFADGSGERLFLESAGGGLLSAGIEALQAPDADEYDDYDDLPSKLAASVRRYREILLALKPAPWRLLLDGAPLAGDFLLVEALNMPSAGPRLTLSDAADPSDGFLTIVTAGEQHREVLSNFLRDRIHDRESPPALPTRRARRIEVTRGSRLHVDGTLRPSDGGRISIRVESGRLQILAHRDSGRPRK